MEIEYLTIEFVFYIHMVAIDETFCEYDGHVAYSQEMRGIKDKDLFKSAVLLPQQTFGGKDLYPRIVDKAACYLRSLAMDHPFFDGNKRTAVIFANHYLVSKGLGLIVIPAELVSEFKKHLINYYENKNQLVKEFLYNKCLTKI